jgi:hypothetical protein
MVLSLCAAALAFGGDSNLPTGSFVLVEGAELKRKIELRVTQTTITAEKAILQQSKLKKFRVSKTLTIDERGGFTEKLFAGEAAISRPVERWQVESSGATTLVLKAPDGTKRNLSYSFDGKRLTLRSGRNQIEVFEKK